jgi:two-component system, OmpR family, sensor histidine kinase KdpD
MPRNQHNPNENDISSDSQAHPADQRLLVCLGPRPGGAHLVKTAWEMAQAKTAEWFALHVGTPAHETGSEDGKDNVAQTLLQAEQLGAETFKIYGLHILDEIISFVRQHDIKTVCLGRSGTNRWFQVFSRSLADKLVQHLTGVDVYLIAPEKQPSLAPRRHHGPLFSFWRDYLLAAGGVTLCTIINLIAFAYLPLSNQVMLYLLTIVIVATLSERGPTIFASITSVLAFAFFFLPHYNSFLPANTEFLLTLVVMIIVSTLISNLTMRVRHQAKVARQQEWQTTALYEMNQTLAGKAELEELLQAAVDQISGLFDSRVSLLLPDGWKKLRVRAGAPLSSEDVREGLVANWVFKHGHFAGAGTQTLPEVKWLYLPLVTPNNQVLGVLRLERRTPSKSAAVEYVKLLEALSRQIALAIEREFLSKQTRQAQLQIETEQLRNTLLSSVSHDLRTPLTVIAGSASSLLEAEDSLDQQTKQELIQNIYEEARRLDRLVHNLLEISRLQSGHFIINKDWHVLEEVLGCALSQLDGQLKEHPVNINLPQELPLVPMDALLLERVFINLLENAAKYTPAGTPIEVAGTLAGPELRLVVADRGSGLPPGQEEKIFEKFYQGRPGTARGAGLGLAICRSIIEAHNGRITAKNRPDGGAEFSFTLPVPEEHLPWESPLTDAELLPDHEA